jgi:hypothetical protein
LQLTMTATEKMDAQKRGRPAVGKGIPIQVRLQPDDLELLDLWIAANAPETSRPEAVRRILRLVAMRMPRAADDDWMASFDHPDGDPPAGGGD